MSEALAALRATLNDLETGQAALARHAERMDDSILLMASRNLAIGVTAARNRAAILAASERGRVGARAAS